MDKELKDKLQEVAELADAKGNYSIQSLCYAIMGAGVSNTEMLLANHVCDYIEKELLPIIRSMKIQSQIRKN